MTGATFAPGERWAATVAIWWALLWRMALTAGILGAALSALGADDGGFPWQRPAVGALSSLLAIRWKLRAPWSVVWRAWWALLWRTAGVGGALILAASLALDLQPYSTADLLIGVAVALPALLWTAWAVVRLVERWSSSLVDEWAGTP